MYMVPPIVCMRAPPATLAECLEVLRIDTALPGAKYLMAACVEKDTRIRRKRTNELNSCTSRVLREVAIGVPVDYIEV